MKTIQRLLIVVLSTIFIVGATSCHHQIRDNVGRKVAEAVSDTVEEEEIVSLDDLDDIEMENDTAYLTSDSAACATDRHSPVVVNVASGGKGAPLTSIMDEDTLIPIIAIVFGVGVPFFTLVAITIAVLVYMFKRNRNRNEVIAKAVEAGYQLPESFYNGGEKAKSRSGQISSAVTLMGVGIVLFAAFFFCVNHFVATICLIPFVIGLGRLVGCLIESKRPEDNRIDQ